MGPVQTNVHLTNRMEICDELRMAYSNEVNKLLFELAGPKGLNITTEEQLLCHIRLVAVKGLHQEVHRHRFHNTRQQVGEGPAQILTKL